MYGIGLQHLVRVLLLIIAQNVSIWLVGIIMGAGASSKARMQTDHATARLQDEKELLQIQFTLNHFNWRWHKLPQQILRKLDKSNI